MQQLKGRIVVSKKGKDKGRFLVIVEDNCEIFVADGKLRPLEKPKKKNLKHLALTNSYLDEAQMATNRSLRKALEAFGTAKV
ncbi:MAG: hypothetical protein ACI4QV_00355 [Acutalibacteraceae bacterium]